MPRHAPFLIACAVVLVTACHGNKEPARSAERSSEKPRPAATRPCILPDISGASESVQTQLRERYASLLPKIENQSTPPAELSAAYGDVGKLLIVSEFLGAADDCFANAGTLAAQDMRWPYYRGHVQRLENEPANAVPFFEQALRLQPDHVPSLLWLGEMDLALSQADAAEPLFAKAQSIQPQSASALYGLGRAALAKQNYVQAVSYLERALALAPQASRLQYPLAMAYRGKGDASQAEAHLRLRGEVDVPMADPLMAELGGLLQNAAAYEVRGAEALGKRQLPEAVANLRKAIELAPDHSTTRLNYGTALYLTGNTKGALEQFQTAVQLAPDLSKAHYGIGLIMQTAGRDREAIDAYAAAVKSDPGSVEARLQLAETLRASGRPADSLAHYGEVIKASPGISQARFGYAMALIQLHRYQEGRKSLSEAAAIYVDQPGFTHALARLLAAAPDDSVRDGQRALALAQDLLKQQRTLGLAETMAMALAETGRFDEAVKWQGEALAFARQTDRHAVPRIEANLRLYEARKPCRTPWPEDDPVFHPRPTK